MADLSDVETAIVSVIIGSFYPDGVSGPSMTSAPVRVYRGWPVAGPLRSDLASGVINVSVFSVPGTSRNTTRWNEARAVTMGVPSLSVSVQATTAVFAGQPVSGEIAGILVDNVPFVYRTKTGDTLRLIAAILGEAIRATRPCTLVGETLTVQGAKKLVARVATDGTTTSEWVRQSQAVRVSAWCPTPDTRDSICSLLGSSLASRAFLSLPDGSSARLRYRSTQSFDEHRTEQQYRRDLVYDAEYGTLALVTTASMLFGDSLLNDTSLYT